MPGALGRDSPRGQARPRRQTPLIRLTPLGFSDRTRFRTSRRHPRHAPRQVIGPAPDQDRACADGTGTGCAARARDGRPPSGDLL